MTNTITSKTLIDAIAAGDSMPLDDLSASGTTKRYTPKYMSDFIYKLLAGRTLIADCLVATTTALTVTYSNGSSGVGATLTNAGTQAAIVIDGVTLSATNRVLVKNQAAPAQNGIYTVTTLGSGATNWVLTRATDYDQAAEMVLGTFTNVTSGTVNANTAWVNTSAGTIVVGTTSINFARPFNALLSGTNSLTLSGAFNGILTITADTNVTLPTSGTLTTLANVLATGNTWGATQTYADNIITGPEFKDFSETTQSVSAASTTTVDYTAGGIVLLSQDTAITTFNITNPSPTGKACSLTFIRTKDATGTARLITWPSGTIWAGGSAPTLSTTTGAIDIITLLTTNAGSTWYGFVAGQALA